MIPSSGAADEGENQDGNEVLVVLITELPSPVNVHTTEGLRKPLTPVLTARAASGRLFSFFS